MLYVNLRRGNGIQFVDAQPRGQVRPYSYTFAYIEIRRVNVNDSSRANGDRKYFLCSVTLPTLQDHVIPRYSVLYRKVLTGIEFEKNHFLLKFVLPRGLGDPGLHRGAWKRWNVVS